MSAEPSAVPPWFTNRSVEPTKTAPVTMFVIRKKAASSSKTSARWILSKTPPLRSCVRAVCKSPASGA